MTLLRALAIALVMGASVACAGDVPLEAREAEITSLYTGYRIAFPDVPDVSASEILTHREAYLLVDVRSAEERAVSVIPGAVTQEAFEADPALAKGKRVVAYCTIGYRSGLYAEALRGRGIDAANLAGSLLAWTWARGPLEQGGEPTKRVHVYGKSWNLVARGYEAVW